MESEEQGMQQMQQRRGISPPGTGEKVGIVFGGVFGGIVGLALIILIIFLIITKVKTGHWGLKFW
jgi:hypothetical protein